MSLADQLRPLLPARVRGRGGDEVEFVVVEESSERAVFATVHGRESHEVTLQLAAPASWSTSCTCPLFRRTGACRHLWAVVREVDERGLTLAAAAQDGAQPTLTALDPRRALWRARMDAVQAQLSGAVSDPWEGIDSRRPQAGNELVYVVDLDDTRSGHGLVLRPFWRARQRNHRWSARRTYDPADPDCPPLADATDRQLFRVLSAARRSRWTDTAHLSSYGARGAFWLDDPEAEAALPLLGASGRAFLHHHGADEPEPFSFDTGEPWAFGVRLERAPRTAQLVGFLVRGDEELDLGDPHLVLPAFLFSDRTVARFDPRGAWALVETLRTDGPLEGPAEDGDELARRLVDLPGHPLIEAEDLPLAGEIEPRPRLAIETDGDGDDPCPCRISFRYGDLEVRPQDPRGALRGPDQRVVRRRWQAERAALEAFLAAGGERPEDGSLGGSVEGAVEGSVDRALVDELALAMLERGFEVELDGRPCRSAADARLAVAAADGGWSLDGALDFAGARADVSDVLAALDAGRARLDLDDGSVGLLPAVVRREWALLDGAGTRAGDGLHFKSSQGWLLDRLLAGKPSVDLDAGFARLRAELAGLEELAPEHEPESFQGTLRGYQRRALAWFRFLRRVGFGGCLADDMGLGKTVVVLALLEQRRLEGAGPSLVVVPRSLLFNWRHEAQRFAPQLSVIEHTGPDRSLERIAGAHLVLTTYGTLRRDAIGLSGMRFDHVVLDEAQAIKNPASHSAKAARLVDARHRLALSGTPIENHLGELWSLLEFLNPGMLGRARAFRELLSPRGERRLDGEGRKLLAAALRPFLLRRTKEEVLPDLPPRIEQTLWIDLGEAQRAEYDALRRYYRVQLAEGEGLAGRGVTVLRALLRLRQASCHPGLLEPDRSEESSAKLEVLLPHLEEIVDSGHKALVFSQFTSHLSVVRGHLESAGLQYSYLDGSTRDREAVVRRFREDPTCPLFLMSLKAGGLGLNLVEADYVFLLDPWWNPAAEAQAVDRAHRIGRTRAVVAYRMVTRDTVEERVVELQHSKRELAEAVLATGDGFMRGLSVEELESLFA